MSSRAGAVGVVSVLVDDGGIARMPVVASSEVGCGCFPFLAGEGKLMPLGRFVPEVGGGPAETSSR